MTIQPTPILPPIDHLPTLLIPKQIPTTLPIPQPHPLQIFLHPHPQLIFNKYSPITQLPHFPKQYPHPLYHTLPHNLLLSHPHSIIPLSRLSKKQYLNKTLPHLIQKTIQHPKSLVITDETQISIIHPLTQNVTSYTLPPILPNPHPIPPLIIFSKQQIITQLHHNTLNTPATFLAKQIHQ
ncbi:stage V sporulation T C-terminal domain-containing protein [Bacillus mycoides]|uniref:stage V sporulation T C-terminal domain-containing protein n=1 Tax=Bacillus mycoides TaxID=1405 RepID=UPI003CC7C8DF